MELARRLQPRKNHPLRSVRYRWRTRHAITPYPSSGADLALFEQELKSVGYHSQHGQDKWVAETILPGRRGVFVDVGAYDGLTLSNTLYLERELGWTGLAVEPNPVAYRKLVSTRRCRAENAAIGVTNGEVTFRLVTGYAEMLSGIADEYDDRHRARIESELSQHGGSHSEIRISSYRLADVLERHGVDQVDYLSIDVEGGEMGVLSSMDFNRVHVSVVGIENNYRDPRIPKFLAERGYVLHSIVGDEFYVRPDLVG
jgi:FkbM family methyltransferase